ncbi:MAG: rRNA (guanine527-N7)-methyltransferase [Pseudonocardiales bacterium]|nr:rRNA (guanine527-N7)-methyltransferase [Pseudonocardiales bacterium]
MRDVSELGNDVTASGGPGGPRGSEPEGSGRSASTESGDRAEAGGTPDADPESGHSAESRHTADFGPPTNSLQALGGDDSDPLPVAAALFGDRLELAQRYVAMLADTGVTHGLIGPKEGDRVWQRHVLNCAVLAELVESGARVLDMGSGAGLPGIPLALARPDLEIVLLEPLARRVDWLRSVLDELGLPLTVVRGRAEETTVRQEWGGADVVTARAVAPLARLTRWALPLLRPGGRLLAMKGASATAEVIRDSAAVRGFGGSAPRVVQCGGTHVDPPATVVVVERTAARRGTREARRTRGRQG